jgi:hypothetical protein
MAVAQEPDQISPASLAGVKGTSAVVTPHAKLNGGAHARQGVPNIDSLVNFNGHFTAPGFDRFGNPNTHWYFNTVGNPPQMHGTTTVNAPVVPVSLDLRDADGNPRFINGQPLLSDVTSFIQPTLDSPVFSNASYSSSPVPTQFSDAIQRAEFFGKAKADWHTLLGPSLKAGRTIVINQSADPASPAYEFALNGDGTCCLFVLIDIRVFENALFNTVVDTIISGDVTTKDMSTYLFPNAYLFEIVNGKFECCVLGFHSYIFDDVSPTLESRWVFDYASWITPGLFRGGLSDVSAFSHEIAESYNDPFVASDNVHDVTPWWLSPNGNCQDTLETGDVIENLPDGLFPVTINNFTYHPQNEALLQWFEFMVPSDAIDGAYSYPNESVLAGPSAFQKPHCTP